MSTLLQMVPAGIDLKVCFTRAGQAMEATLRPGVLTRLVLCRSRPAAHAFEPSPHGRVPGRKRGRWALRETKESLQQVFNSSSNLRP